MLLENIRVPHTLTHTSTTHNTLPPGDKTHHSRVLHMVSPETAESTGNSSNNNNNGVGEFFFCVAKRIFSLFSVLLNL